MGEVVFYFDRDPIDERIRVDYRWEKDDVEYIIENIPCIDFPFACVEKKKEYMTKEVSDALALLIHLLETDEEVPKVIDFMKIEGLVEKLE